MTNSLLYDIITNLCLLLKGSDHNFHKFINFYKNYLSTLKCLHFPKLPIIT